MTILSKKTAVSPANIAFIKFWGKKNPKLNLPFNDSISMNLSSCLTTTSVQFSPNLKEDEVAIGGKKVKGEAKDRVKGFLDIVRKWAKVSLKAKVVSKNSFPSDAGIASSASGFSALALAASSAAGLDLTTKRLSILARLGSGSASRSVVDGFVQWKKGKYSSDSFSFQIAKPSYWDLRDIVVVVSKKKKKKSSTEGHEAALTSPYFAKRQNTLPLRTKKLKKAFKERQFEKFGEIIEEEAIDLHIIAMTSKPAIFYLNKGTFEVLEKLGDLRQKGIKGYFSMDAGPNVHVICRQKDAEKLNYYLKKLPSVKFTIVNKPAIGARLTNNHLF